MAASYNHAIEIAKGEILCLLDSDDFWFPQKLEWVDRAFAFNPDIVMLQHPLQIHDQFEATQEYYRPYLLSGDIMQYARETKEIPLFVATTGLSFKMEVAKKVLPIPLNFHNNGEAFLTRTVICFGKTEALSIPLGGYRRTGTNVVFGNTSWDAYEYIETVLKPGLNKFYAKHHLNLYFAPTVKHKKAQSIFGKVKSIARRLKK
jgi:glycosyltransferase involved in cell wall biosynthesis